MSARSRRHVGGAVAAALFVLLALLAVGCSRATKSPVAPGSEPLGSDTRDAQSLLGGGSGFPAPIRVAGWARFFPLDSGSVWIYTETARTFSADTTGIRDTSTSVSSFVTRMEGTVLYGGTPYAHSTETSQGGGGFVADIFYRQDARGLYELDTPIRDPGTRTARSSPIAAAVAARIAGATSAREREAWRRVQATLETRLGALDAALRGGPIATDGPNGQPEIQRLAYPLRVGNRWIVRPDPLFIEVVEGRDVVPVAGQRLPAFRIRIEAPGFLRPDDRVHLWYSPEGLLRFRYHVALQATDDVGNPVGTLVTELDRVLREFHLAGIQTRITGVFGPRPQADAATSASAPPYSRTVR